MREKQRCRLYRFRSFLVGALPVWGGSKEKKKLGTNLCALLKRLAHLIGKLLHKSSLSIMGLCSDGEVGGKCAGNMKMRMGKSQESGKPKGLNSETAKGALRE